MTMECENCKMENGKVIEVDDIEKPQCIVCGNKLYLAIIEPIINTKKK